ncbi:Uncharacterized protein Fot_50362 [Forsythia ovata]|uniref:Uncharacterized protein n=1 Tax=Forsythia ovata TaxID=205694 RepID=A0ABD1PXX0_9LAMI
MELIEDECPWFKKAVERHASSGSADILPQNAIFRVILQSRLLTRSEDECTYFKWDNDQPSGGFVEEQSSSVGLNKSVGKEINEDLPSMFKMLASLSEEKDVKISLNLTIRKGRGKDHDYCNSGVSNTFCGILNSDPCSSNALQICTE